MTAATVRTRCFCCVQDLYLGLALLEKMDISP
jgi:hypothetical protein